MMESPTTVGGDFLENLMCLDVAMNEEIQIEKVQEDDQETKGQDSRRPHRAAGPSASPQGEAGFGGPSRKGCGESQLWGGCVQHEA